jgi:histidinol dehydrogenase
VSDLTLFARGPIADLADDVVRHLMERTPADEPSVIERVAAILSDVRTRGDGALTEMARRFDHVALTALEVPKALWYEALEDLDPAVRNALARASVNIRRFHEAQLPTDVTVEVEPGVRVTRRWTPLERVGVYAPGGTAAYPSSVLMGVVPARAAGVGQVVVCSPPGPSGAPPAEVLAACALAGADRLFALGGAGAVAALAYGTESVPCVDAIVGPGNLWVTEAKRQVAGRVVIDSPAGPSEVLVLADAGADPELVAREVLAQAEHDRDAACVVVVAGGGGTDGKGGRAAGSGPGPAAGPDDTPPSPADALAASIVNAIAGQLAGAPRREVATAALAAHGAVLVAADLDEAVAFARAWAPEHLSVMTSDAGVVASRINTAGTTFVGPFASVAFGDYLTGANHVLPTAGRARSFSGLSVQHYLRSYTVQEITAEGAAALADDVSLLADAEGLPAHRAAAQARRGT